MPGGILPVNQPQGPTLAFVMLGMVTPTPQNRTNIPALAPYVIKYAVQFGIDTPKRLAAFLAQSAVETDDWNTLTEYHSGSAYEGRKDLGNTHNGDGPKFKGRGTLQNTGRSNYAALSKKFFGNENVLLNKPELVATPELAVYAGMYYWTSRKYGGLSLNQLADAGDTTRITKAINGGTTQLSDRMAKYTKALMFTAPLASVLSEEIKKKAQSSTVDLNTIGNALGNAFSFFFFG